MSRTAAIFLLSVAVACGDDSADTDRGDLGADAGAVADAGQDLGSFDAGSFDAGSFDAGRCDVDGDGVESEACGGADCDDEDALRSPANVEVCDERDNDCDGDVDEAVSQTVYRDMDGDGFGDASESMQVCSSSSGYVSGDTDCDDADPAVNPSNPELCEGSGVDEDCDGEVNEDCGCSGETARPCNLPGVCAAGTQMCIDGTFGSCSISPTLEVCEGSADEDCDGMVDEGC